MQIVLSLRQTLIDVFHFFRCSCKVSVLAEAQFNAGALPSAVVPISA